MENYRNRTVVPCSCLIAGWCDRHAMHKHGHWHQLCQTKESYRRAWDAHRGPGQPRREKADQREQRRQRTKERAERRRLLHGWIAFLRRPSDRGPGDSLLWMIDACKPHQQLLRRMLKDELQICDCDKRVAAETLNARHPY